jgi:CheY-like chemotaxis protein
MAKILLVEDATDLREAFEALLRVDGFDVVAAANGRDAIDVARSRRFDVLLTDLGLPDIPGDALIRHVLATAPARPRVVVLTGYGEPYAGRARQAGADAVLIKPVEWSEVIGALTPATAPVAA